MSTNLNPLRAVGVSVSRAFSEVRLLAVLLSANLIVALGTSLLVLAPSFLHMGRSLSGRGLPFPSFQVITDLSRAVGPGTSFLVGGLGLSLVLAFGQQLFFAGGIAYRLWTGGPFTLSEFTRHCARLLGRNARLFLWSLLGLIPVVGVAAGTAALMKLAELPTLFTLKPEIWIFDTPFSGWSVAHLALVLVLYALWRSSVDLARVQILAEDLRKTRLAAWRALKRMLLSPRALLGYMAVALVGTLAVIGLMQLRAAVEVTTVGKAWLALILGQLVILGRLAFSVATSAFAVEVHRATPQPAVAAPVPQEAQPPTPPQVLAS
jgi:hypothetical protein